MADDGVFVVDLRSDTVTKPTPEMRQAMAEAVVGDDVYREDPTVLELEKQVAEFLGKEAALFVPTGTMGNQSSIMAHCWGRGQEILVGDESHIYMYEQGGTSQLCGVHSRIMTTKSDGTFDLEELKLKIQHNPNQHACLTALICLENTHNRCGGRVLPIDYVEKVCELAKSYNIPVHMDGARIVNAAVYLGQPVATLVKSCDSVSMCLSKGLGAPVGSIVAGSAEFISRVFRCRKVLGGAMRQVGVLAAAGIVALKSVRERLQVDHDNTITFATGVAELHSSLVTVDTSVVQTNMVLLNFNTSSLTANEFVSRMKEVTEKEMQVLRREIVVKTCLWSAHQVRCVLHSDVSNEAVEEAIRKLTYVVRSIESLQEIN